MNNNFLKCQYRPGTSQSDSRQSDPDFRIFNECFAQQHKLIMHGALTNGELELYYLLSSKLDQDKSVEKNQLLHW